MSNPTQGMKEEAQRGLDWREEHGRGGTRVGAVRARQIVAGENLSDETIKRMYSFFSRHEVDKQAEGFKQGEDGYPSNGRIAWALWGGDAGYSWSKRLVEQMKKEQERAVSGKALEMIKNKVEEHNEEVGDAKTKRTNVSTLSKVYERGIGAYKTNPASVRPSVSSPEQWAAARINSFLFALRNGKFRSGKHDTDLLPEGHPLSTKNKEEKAMENKEDRHILNVSETDDKVIVEFAKHEDVEHEGDEVETTDEVSMLESDEEERKVIDMPMKYRTIDLSKASYIDEESRRVRVGVSSEEPVERSFGMEVLGHSADDINMEFINSGRAPLLLDHDMEKQIGVIEEFKLDETAKRTTAVVRFGKSALAQEIFEDVADGIRMNISVGYRVDKLTRMNKDDENYYKAQWTPMEVSSVSVPADQSRLVGVGRSKDKQNINNIEVITMENKDINLDEVRAQTIDEAKAEFKRNSKEIIDLAARHNKRDLADKAIADGISVEEFRGVLLENISNNTPLETPSEIGMTKEEVREFSLVRAIRAMANPSDRRAQEEAAFEFECSAEAARQYGKDAQGIMLPAEVLSNWGKRDADVTDNAGLVAEDYKGSDFIDILRNESSVMRAGATMLRGLQGNVVIPKKTATAAAGWIATEGGNSASDELEVGSVTMSPKVVGAHTDVTRLLLQQSSLDVENLIRDDLTKSIATAIDLGALAGSGSSGQPTGIANTSGINTTTFGAANPTWAEIVAMESAVASENALNGSLSYICRPADFGTLKTTEKASGTAQFVVSPDNTMNGYNVIRSNQVTSGDFYFGNFADLLIGMYGGLDITVDAYSLSQSGGVRIVALQTVDTAVRHAVSFCKSSD
jgi:HK97 family phage major capsid protein